MRRWVAASMTAVALSACAPEDVVVATLAPDAGADSMQDEPPPGNGGCATNADCGETSFCAKSACGDPTGSCQLRPVECDGDDMRSCGCDGVTYWNDCLRQQYGVAYSTMGECRVDAAMCTNDTQSCPVPSASCERLLTSPNEPCDPAAPAACWVLPMIGVPCTGPGGGPPGQWVACGPPSACVDTCAAIRSGLAYHPADPSMCH